MDLKNKLYVITDEKLDNIYASVQGCHAVVSWMNDNLNNLSWNNDYLIFVKSNLDKAINYLEMNSIPYSKFFEPDLNNQLTAIAVNHESNFLKKLPLLR